MTAAPRVLIADDHLVVADALALSLKRWFEVVGIVTDLDLLQDEIEITSPAIVLLDVTFGKKNSIERLPCFVARFPNTKFLILTAHDEPVIADAAIRFGAKGYVLKESSTEELKGAMEEALEGKIYLPAALKARGAGGCAPRRDPRLESLSDRQRDVIGLLREGHTNAVIAERLAISIKTVDYHLDFLARRLGVRGKAQLIRWSERFFVNEDQASN